MQPEGDALNPYAAPQSDVTPLGVPETPMPRPASTKWAIAVAILFLVVGVFTANTRIAQGDVDEVNLSPLACFDLTTRFICLVALLAGSRRPWGYYLGAIALVMYLIVGARNIWLSATYEAERIDFETLVIGSAGISLLAYLCYRFIFGLPSHRFYRVTQR